MQPENPNDLATIHWEAVADVLRANGIHEDEIFKGGKHFRAGFVKGFECGYRHKQDNDDEDDEPTQAIGFQQETEDEDDE